MSLFSFFIDAFHFIYLFLAALGLCCFAWPSLVVISASFHCGGFSYCEAQALEAQASAAVAHRLSCSVACGIFLGQGSNLCPLHWQADS